VSTPEPPHFGPVVARFDAAADRALDRLRGNRAADAIINSATHLGDWSLIWHLIGSIRGLTSDARALEAYRLSTLLGVESLAVNQGVKRLFARTRPAKEHWTPGIRTPLTSSFPSGHASAAFFAATLLSSEDRRFAPVWYGLATVVGMSRAYTRVHHASDVVAGAALGLTLGLVARRALR